MANGTDRSVLGAYARALLAVALAGLVTAVVDIDGFSSFLTVVVVFLLGLLALEILQRVTQDR